jgi:VWFA-related protein
MPARSISAVLLASMVLLAAVRAQQPPTTFRTGVEIVDVDVSVLDTFRRPVTGLTSADFTVLEDGKPRPVVAFTPVDLASRTLPTAPWLNEIAPDAQTNSLERAGRLVVVLFDRSIALTDVPSAKRVAEAAVEQLRPADLAAIVYTEYGIPQNFTSDRGRLLAAIRQPAANLPEGDSGAASPCFCGTCTLERITTVANAVRDVRQRRKVLLVISSNLPATGRGGCSAAIGEVRGRALRAIGAANLTVHVFDPSGVPTLMANAASREPSRRGGLANLQRLGNLRILPDQTGGRAVVGNAPEQALTDIFRESNSYYVLGFTPGHADGHFHEIAVKVDRRDVVLQARRGYIAAGAKASRSAAAPKGVSPALFDAIAGWWPKSTLPLTITATPIAAAGLRSAAVITSVRMTPAIDATAADATASSGILPPRQVHALVGAFDRNGQALAYQQGSVELVPHTDEQGRTTYDLAARIELKPGHYELRAAVEDVARGAIGSVYTSVDVPPYLTDFLSLSGIFFTTDPPLPIGLLNAPWPERLSRAPIAFREFSRADHVTASLQIYQGLRRPAMAGYLVAEIRDENDQRVFRQETRMLEGDAGDNRAITERFDLPIDALTPGEYLLTIEMRQGNASVQRDARFQVHATAAE